MLDASQIGGDSAFFRYVRKEVLPVSMSQYDIASKCNLFCEGCLFFASGTHKKYKEETDLQIVDRFFESEAARGVNYAYIGGAEPSLVEEKLVIAARHIRRGVVFTNGIKAISKEVSFRLHVSLWGMPDESAKLRGADVVEKAIANYRHDERAIFVFTINHQNIESIPEIVLLSAENGLRLTFNHFSPPSSYNARLDDTGERDPYFRFSDTKNNLILTSSDLARSCEIIGDVQRRYPETVLYNETISSWTHNPQGIYDIDPATGIARNCASRLTDKIRHFDADLRDGRGAKCCCPNIECGSCRLYLQALSAAIQKPTKEQMRGKGFADWMSLWRLWCSLFLLDRSHEHLVS